MREEGGGGKGPWRRCTLPPPPCRQQASPHVCWGNARTAPRTLAGQGADGGIDVLRPSPMFRGFMWELLSTNHFRLFELSLKAISPRDVSAGEVNWDCLGPTAILGLGKVAVPYTLAGRGWIISNIES